MSIQHQRLNKKYRPSSPKYNASKIQILKVLEELRIANGNDAWLKTIEIGRNLSHRPLRRSFFYTAIISLAKQGLIERRVVPDDKRSSSYRITEKGTALVASVKEQQ